METGIILKMDLNDTLHTKPGSFKSLREIIFI